jgi:hypothetical protein
MGETGDDNAKECWFDLGLMECDRCGAIVPRKEIDFDLCLECRDEDPDFQEDEEE